MVRISVLSARNAGELNAGGGGGRNCAPDVSRYGLTPPNVTPAGGPFAGHIPGPTGTVPVHGALKRSVLSCSTIAAPVISPTAKPRAKSGCTLPGPTSPS